MARNPKVKKRTVDRRPKPSAAAGGRPRRGRPKVCLFCSEHADWVDYKDVGLLRRFMNDRGRIKARGATGTCAQHQRDVAAAVKTARELALLPYVLRTTATESRGGRGGERRGSGPAARVVEGRASGSSGPTPAAIAEAEEGDTAVLDEATDLSQPAPA